MLLFEWTLVLPLAAVLLAALARRLEVPYPAPLALAGAVLAFLPIAPPARWRRSRTILRQRRSTTSCGCARSSTSARRSSGESAIGDEAYHRLEEEIDWAELDAAPAGRFQPLTA